MLNLGDRLWGKREKDENRHVAKQSVECGIQHSGLANQLNSTNLNMEKMLDILRTKVNADQLEHQVTLSAIRESNSTVLQAIQAGNTALIHEFRLLANAMNSIAKKDSGSNESNS